MRKLRPCQPPMIDHMIKHRRCGIFADVGVGKTSAVLQVLEDLSLVEPVYPVLVCATLRVARDTWREEAPKWEQFKHLRIVSLTGDTSQREIALRQNADIYCINYEQIPWLVDKLKDNWPFKTIIADESTKLRGFRLRQGTKRSRALASIAHTKVNRFILLTGTPAASGLQGLWGQIWFLDKGERLGRSFEAFKQRWFMQGFDGYSIKPLPHAQKEIQEKISDICLSIDAKDYFDIKEPIINDIYVTLPPKAMRLYKEMEKRMFVEIGNKPVEAFNAASRTGKCLQLGNGALYTDDKGSWEEVHNAKIEALEDIVEEANGMPIMVAYNFVSDKERLLSHFKNATDLSTKKGLALFKAGGASMGIAHPASLGHGIDGLQDVTNILVFFGQSWDLELYDQIIGRIGPVRQMQSGHNRPVFLHHILARHTVDEAVMARRNTKRDVQDLLLEYLKNKM